MPERYFTYSRILQLIPCVVPQWAVYACEPESPTGDPFVATPVVALALIKTWLAHDGDDAPKNHDLDQEIVPVVPDEDSYAPIVSNSVMETHGLLGIVRAWPLSAADRSWVLPAAVKFLAPAIKPATLP